MASFVLTTEAAHDMEAIGRYTEGQWDRAQRDRYLTQLVDSFQQLADMPGIGQDYSHIHLGYRKHPVGRHLIFYWIISDDLMKLSVFCMSAWIVKHS